jgi:ribosome-associated translation inhibitor RaiA
MKIQINTDKNVEGHERANEFFSSELEKELSRFDNDITRIEVHIGDENGDKFGKNDSRCLIEVRIANRTPIAVTAYEETTEKAFFTALGKIKKVLETTFDKMKQH